MTACTRPLAAALLLTLAGCGTLGGIDTGAMQTTNRAVGAPLNGPGNPPSPHQ